MGRMEALTAMALGRGPYEDEVAEWTQDINGLDTQLYDEHGHPRNPETRRRERENVRAANEVMQVTGVVEDSMAAKIKAAEAILNKNRETFAGLRMMEVGRATLVGGVWGVLGLRRRVLLYKPYAHLGLWQILQQESNSYGLLHVLGSGLPAVVAYHAADWAAFFLETVLDAFWEGNENEPEHQRQLSPLQAWLKDGLQECLDVGACYITIHLRMFAILQQLNLIPSSRLLPSLRSFIPFSSESPLLFPPAPAFNPRSISSWTAVFLRSMNPIFLILLHGKIKYFASRILYRPIYTLLPRPIGDSMFAGLTISPPTMEYDTPDQTRQNPSTNTLEIREHEPTLRALEGFPVERTDDRHGSDERDSDSSNGEDGELTHATLISFDVEASDTIESAAGAGGQWSAELRSANEPKNTEAPKYNVTGMTMLPPIMATEGLREIAAGILVMPVEAFMIRYIGKAYRASAGLDVEDFYTLSSGIHGIGNILSALTLQLAVTSIVWAGFTITSQLWVARQRAMTKAKTFHMVE